MMTPNELADALTLARPGDRITYFTGHLSTTCETPSRDQDPARAIQAYALSQAAAGRALLVQKRAGEVDGFRYIAVKTGGRA